MKPTKELITRIKKLRDTDDLNFRQISEHLKEVDKLDITRQSAERIYKTNPDVKVWSKWSLFTDQWKKELEAGSSINQIAKEYGVRPSAVHYQMEKIGVTSTAKSGPKIKKEVTKMTLKEKEAIKKELEGNDIQFISYNKKSKSPLYFRDNRGLETDHLYFKNYKEVSDWWGTQKELAL